MKDMYLYCASIVLSVEIQCLDWIYMYHQYHTNVFWNFTSQLITNPL